MKVSDYIAAWLKSKGVNTVFGYQGSSITHLIDSIEGHGIKYVQNYHEQASAFCANAYAHVSDNFGVALACSGPGATNLITGIANAYYDSLPCLFFTGQVSRKEMKTNSLLRQNGFQETDIVAMTAGITKYSITVKDPDEIRYHLEKALYLLKSGRSGPVVIDLPHDIQKEKINENKLLSFYCTEEYFSLANKVSNLDTNNICLAAKLICEAERPIFLFGGGMRHLKNTVLLKRFIQHFNIPIVASLRGIDIVPHDNNYYFGFIGAYGNRYANLALACADLVIVLGSRLDGRQTGGLNSFAPKAKIIQVDIDAAELSKGSERVITVEGDCEVFLEKLQSYLIEKQFDFLIWNEKLKQLKGEYPSICELKQDDKVNPNMFIDWLFKAINASCVVAGDVGQNQMWLAQSAFLKAESYFLVSAGHGAMGYALPAIIGAAYLRLGKPLICIVGDGGIQMNLQELQMIARDRLNIKIIIMNNQSLGLIRDYQNTALGARCYGSVEGYSLPNFRKIAKAYGIAYRKIESNGEFEQLRECLYMPNALIVEVMISKESRVAPEPAFGRPFYDQSPPISKEKIHEVMNGEKV